ncbi:coiled-coil domain-containing protein 201 [Ochotona princeps]|uniref:coiled-coil domain-containing protein 201 n=1 Tax=Ochotona princeps TaxID=9978 RepID=UPI0027145AF2|nr:coiled-coil domain-containing protein 201 [Ochotona princeps]
MGPEGQPLGLNSSELESPSFLRRRPLLRKLIKHSTPEEEEAFSWSFRLLGDRLDLSERGSAGGSPLPVHFQGRCTHLTGVNCITPFRRKRLSTVWASGESSRRSGPEQHQSAPGREMSGSSLLVLEQHQDESLHISCWPGLPGISNVTHRKRRNLKKLAAAMERVRQWERHLLQNIEEATQHQLTIQVRKKRKPEELKLNTDDQHQISPGQAAQNTSVHERGH